MRDMGHTSGQRCRDDSRVPSVSFTTPSPTRRMSPRFRRPALLAAAALTWLLAVGAPSGAAREATRLHFTASLTRLSGDKLLYRTSATGYFQSLLIELRRPGYKITWSVLTSEDGERTATTPSTSPCYPAPAGYLRGHAGVECPSLLYQNGGHMGVKSVTIVFGTNRCYPRNGGILDGVNGPSTACRS